MSPDELAEAVEDAISDPRFSFHLASAVAQVERTDRHGTMIIVHFDNGQALMVTTGRVPDPRYL